ncbi:MAG: extracellular solute-binding protein family 1 [Leifsonia sp.]|nr:extracellular solute-binding protein family 1 [Leifsonia sp.]
MKKKHRLAAVIGLSLSASLALSSCAGASGTASSSSSTQGKTLTIWYMQDSLTPASIAAINKIFETQTGAKVTVETQQWNNINTKLTTALATNNPPDIVEIGNTDVPLFAATGALADITSSKKSLSGGQTWLTGLEGPATVNGKLYAAPLYGGTREMIYNKTIWAAAGITTPPTTYAEMTADLDKIKAANPASDFSAAYISGTNWYSGISFLYAAGGAIAKQSGGTWKAQFATPGSQKGLQQFTSFQNAYSANGSQTAPLATPNPIDVFATGKAATVMLPGGNIASIEAANPALKGQIGSFVIPSLNHPGRNMPSFLGGSDLGIAAKSTNQALALKYLKLLTSDTIQIDQITKVNGAIPISTQLVNKVLPGIPANLKAFYDGAKNTISTPATAGWATIESDQTILGVFSQVAAGTKSAKDAASSMDAHLNTALNASN